MSMYTCDCCGSDESEVNVVAVEQPDDAGNLERVDTIYLCDWCSRQSRSIEKVIDGPEYPTIPGVPDARDGDAD